MPRTAEPARPRWAFGPGVVHLLASLGTNDLIANSVAGATYGYSLLWALVIAYGLHYAIAEATSRYVVSTGESIMEGYGRLGRPVMLALAAAIFIRRHLNNLFQVLLLGTAAHMLLPLPTTHSTTIWSLLSFVLAYALMFRGGYAGVERVSKVVIVVLAGSFVIVAAMARPAPLAVVRGLLIPECPGAAGFYSYVLLLMALAGTTVGSINHLKYPAYVYEKGWRGPADASRQRVDLALSVIGQFLLAVTIQVAAAATLFHRGVTIRTVEDLSRVFSGPLGDTGRVVLGVGIWAAALMSYIGSNTGYSLLVADTYERFIYRPAHPGADDRRAEIREHAYRVLLTFFCVSPLYVLFTRWEPFWLAIVSSAFFFMLTPLLLVGLLLMTNDRIRMRDRVNRWWSNVTIGIAMAVSLALSYQSAVDWIGGLAKR